MSTQEKRETFFGMFLSVMSTIVAAGIIALVTMTYGLQKEFLEYKAKQANWRGHVDAKLNILQNRIDRKHPKQTLNRSNFEQYRDKK